MFKWIMLFLTLTLCLLLQPVNLLSADSTVETINVEFTFPQSPTPDGYKLYLEGTQICQIDDGSLTTFDCSIPALPYGDNNFSMTALIGEKESPMSPNYVFTKDILSPDITKVTVVVSVTITK